LVERLQLVCCTSSKRHRQRPLLSLRCVVVCVICVVVCYTCGCVCYTCGCVCYTCDCMCYACGCVCYACGCVCYTCVLYVWLCVLCVWLCVLCLQRPPTLPHKRPEALARAPAQPQVCGCVLYVHSAAILISSRRHQQEPLLSLRCVVVFVFYS